MSQPRRRGGPAAVVEAAALEASGLSRLLAWREGLAFYLALMVVAAILRFGDLGSRALHHDESLHAIYSWYLFTGRGYQHDPMMHGPFKFEATAFIYFLFGVSDATARFLPALLGTALVGTPYFLRQRLGRGGALVVAGLLTFSPAMLYVSRFARDDIVIAFWSMLMVIATWCYFQKGERRYLFFLVATLALSFATMETTFITVAIFGSYWLAVTAREWWQALRNRLNLSELSRGGVVLLLLGTFTLPQLGSAAAIFQRQLGIVLVRPAGAMTGAPEGTGGYVAAIGIVVALLGVAAVVGIRWQAGLWFRLALVFWGIYFILYTTFFTNIVGFGTGIWGSLGYWLAQQGVQRGGQPWYYYFILMTIYEFLPLILSLIGAFIYARRGDLFSRFLLWWVVGAFLLYGYAGEKMPWLSVHLALPLILLGGKLLGEAIEAVDWGPAWRQGGALFMALIPIVLLGLAALLGSGGIGGDRLTSGLLLVAAVAATLAGLGWLGQRLGLKTSLQLGGLALAAILFAFTVRAATQASYAHGDVPVEMLVYTQTSPEIPRIRDEIDRLARQTGEGKDLSITVDASSGFTWPWAWYLRDYKNVDYPDLSYIGGAPRGSVLLLHANNQQRAEPYLGKYGPGRRFPHRWWFPEDYRGLTLGSLVGDVFDLKAWGQWWSYFLYRKTSSPLGSEDVVAYFPKGAELPPATTAPPPTAPPAVAPTEEAPATELRASLVIGGQGSGQGQFETPKGIALDAAGNIYVADTYNHRIQKFNSLGQFLAQVGVKGSGPGEFNEPWGVAVDGGGNVYVADTWNHRIQKLDANLSFLAQWGDFGDARTDFRAAPGRFYGPRALAVDAAGNIYVADTGNKRVQKLAPDGSLVAAYGGDGPGPGQFREPVGIATDRQGRILVADTWNRRIQRFDPAFNYLDEMAVSGWRGEGVLNKPYLVASPDGSVVATDPESHRLLRFTAQGKLRDILGRRGTAPGQLGLPTGVALDAQGRLWVADSGNHRVQRLEPTQ